MIPERDHILENSEKFKESCYSSPLMGRSLSLLGIRCREEQAFTQRCECVRDNLREFSLDGFPVQSPSSTHRMSSV